MPRDWLWERLRNDPFFCRLGCKILTSNHERNEATAVHPPAWSVGIQLLVMCNIVSRMSRGHLSVVTRPHFFAAQCAMALVCPDAVY